MDENKRNNKFMYVYNRFTRVYLKFFVSDWNSFIELRQVIVMCNCLIDNFQNRISHSWPCLDYGGFINMHWIPIFVDFIVKLIHEIINILIEVQFILIFCFDMVIYHELLNCDFYFINEN